MAIIDTFLAAVSAIAAITQVMIAQQDRLERFPIIEKRGAGHKPELPPGYQKALSELNEEAKNAGDKAADDSRALVRSDPAYLALEREIPEPIVVVMTENVMRCWERLKHFLSDDCYTPVERQLAHMRARRCVCAELIELKRYLRQLPDDLQKQWNACDCDE